MATANHFLALPLGPALILQAILSFALFAGCVYVARFIAPGFQVAHRVRYGAILFFMATALTQVGAGLHALVWDGVALDDFAGWASGIVRGLQVIGLWLFITGLREVARDKGDG